MISQSIRISLLFALAQNEVESLSQNAGAIVAVTDRDHVIAVSGGGKKELLQRPISKELEQRMDDRENVIAEALCKQGYELFYYKKENSTLEQDFFVRTKKSLVPVEVKATNGKAKSLSTLIKSDSYPDITTGIKLIQGNIGFENNIHTLPYFCTFLLKRYLSEVDF